VIRLNRNYFPVLFCHRNIQEEDFGYYYFATESTLRRKSNYTAVLLQKNIIPSLNSYIGVSIVGCIVCLTIIALLVIIHQNSAYFKLILKKVCYPPEIGI